MNFYSRLWRRTPAWLAPLAAACGALALSILPAQAAPLDKASCVKLAEDMQNMKALDVDGLMQKGPAWAVSHLASADLSLIRRYIDLDEQMKFRCSAPSSLVHLKHLEEDDDENGQRNAAEPSDGDPKKAQSGDAQEGAPAPAPADKRKTGKPVKAAKAPPKENAQKPEGSSAR